MKSIPEATPIILTEAERTELEALARSTKTEYRLRQRARIVLLAAGGLASRAIGREVGCTTGTASKWRVRYAANRLAGLDETGNRGAAPKYTAETDQRILAVLDRPVPAGYARWTGPLIAAALADVAAGDTVEAIATSRRVSQNTIRAHVRDILKKTGCNRQADMIALLIRETARPPQLVETERVEAYKTSARL
jgi:transposase